ncbi:MAG TPA: ribonuclease P protein component [Candidatus Acidoferrum sp.]|nr:ribonuclease P protein component [Candidatus Acidoferrum sp.]
MRLGTTDIAALLAGGPALRRNGFSVLLRANAFGVPRLGLIVPKRVFPRAVDRNRMKRVLRELFRAQQARLGSRDILIRVNSGKFSLAEVEQALVGAQ